MNGTVAYILHALALIFYQFALNKREQLCKAIQIFLKKFYLEISSHCLIVLVWSNISHFQNSTVFRFIGKLSHKVFQALTLVDILESFLNIALY